MRARWKECSLGDCVTLQSGGTPSKQNHAYWNGDIPWVSCKDMKTNRLYDAEDHLTKKGAKNGTRTVQPGTILIVVRGMILAKDFPVAIAKRELAFNQDLKAVTCTKDVDHDFLYYWLIGNKNEIKGIVDEAAHGTSRIQTDRLLGLRFSYPDLPTQRKIAGILSAYDDLIENNLRRIKILEEMAQSLYREWFVHFRFPGHESAKFVDSPLGQIPEGWEVKKLVECTSLLSRGITPKYDKNGDSIVINQKCIRNERLTLDHARRQSKQIPVDKLIRRGDILVNSTGVGTLGRVAQVEYDAVQQTVDTHITILRPNAEVEPLYFGQTMFRLQNIFEILGVGSTGQTELSRAVVSAVTIMIPPLELQTRYGSLVTQMREASNAHLSKNKTLRRTRDLLLPKLFSGDNF